MFGAVSLPHANQGTGHTHVLRLRSRSGQGHSARHPQRDRGLVPRGAVTPCSRSRSRYRRSIARVRERHPLQRGVQTACRRPHGRRLLRSLRTPVAAPADLKHRSRRSGDRDAGPRRRAPSKPQDALSFTTSEDTAIQIVWRSRRGFVQLRYRVRCPIPVSVTDPTRMSISGTFRNAGRVGSDE